MRLLIAFFLLLSLSNTAYAQEECPLMPRLTPGEGGRVLFTNGDPLNMREQPRRNSEVIGQISEGTSFLVLDSAPCADGIHWWQVDAGSQSGWVAEGADSAYFVEPVSLAQVEADEALVEELEKLDPATRLLVMDDGFLQLKTLDSDVVAAFSARSNVRLQNGILSHFDGESLHLWSRDDAERTIAAPAFEPSARLVDAAPSLNGETIAWFYESCDTTAFNCSGLQTNTLALTDSAGENARVLWQGEPLNDAVDLLLDGWHGDVILLRHQSAIAYPEPGSDPTDDPGYPPEGSYFIVVAPDGSSTTYSPLNTEAGMSDDGQWITYDTGERYIRQVPANTLRAEARSGEIIDIAFATENRIYRPRFAPDNAYVVWLEVTYADYNRELAELKSAELATGVVRSLYRFETGYPTMLGWLDTHLLVVSYAESYFIVDIVTVGIAPFAVEGRLMGVMRP